MIQTVQRKLEFGIYRDGDNNLDEIQAKTLSQALAVSKRDDTIAFFVEDTTARRGVLPAHVPHTETYGIRDGEIEDRKVERAHDMSSRENLARFVTRTLEAAHDSGAAQTWIDLVDHGGGDGGGLENDHTGTLMRADDMAGAIADGVAAYRSAHADDARRGVDGVVANQCLMATLGFADALSHADVKYLAASPETMLAPGVPSTVSQAIAGHIDDPARMARSVVDTTMATRYPSSQGSYGPAAAFDVLDLAPAKFARVETSVRALDAALAGAAHDGPTRTVLREDARAIDGMARFTREALPWRADRPAIELYRTFASDGRLPENVRGAAAEAGDAVAATVLAHREAGAYAPFHDASYADAAGPTVHFPLTRKQIDPWAPQLSETDNAFYRAVGAERVTRALA